MTATMMFLSPATRRISPGSLVTTVIWPSDADWMTAPMCESATETSIGSRMPAAVLVLTVSSGQSAIRRRFGKTHAGASRREQPAQHDREGGHGREFNQEGGGDPEAVQVAKHRERVGHRGPLGHPGDRQRRHRGQSDTGGRYAGHVLPPR